MSPEKPTDELLARPEIAAPKLIIHCGLRTPQEDAICDEAWAHLIVMPEECCEAEFRWRTCDGITKTLWLEGPRVIFVPKNTPYKILWEKTAAYLRMSVSDAFIAKDAAVRRNLASVQIRHEWQLASVDFLAHLLFEKFDLRCRGVTFPGTDPYIGAAGHLFAVQALKIFADNETGASSGLAFPALKRVLAYVDQNLSEPIRVADMAREANLGTQYFTKLFKISMGMTPHCHVRTGFQKFHKTSL